MVGRVVEALAGAVVPFAGDDCELHAAIAVAAITARHRAPDRDLTALSLSRFTHLLTHGGGRIAASSHQAPAATTFNSLRQCWIT